jgi:hypothetical protein
MPLLLELEKDQLEWIIACCRLHTNDSEFQSSVIHLLESLQVCLRLISIVLLLRLEQVETPMELDGNTHEPIHILESLQECLRG